MALEMARGTEKYFPKKMTSSLMPKIQNPSALLYEFSVKTSHNLKKKISVKCHLLLIRVKIQQIILPCFRSYHFASRKLLEAGLVVEWGERWEDTEHISSNDNMLENVMVFSPSTNLAMLQ